MSRKPEGLFVTDLGRVLVQTAGGTLAFGMSPAELRDFAADLNRAADRMEADAAGATSAALTRAGGLQ